MTRDELRHMLTLLVGAHELSHAAIAESLRTIEARLVALSDDTTAARIGYEHISTTTHARGFLDAWNQHITELVAVTRAITSVREALEVSPRAPTLH